MYDRRAVMQSSPVRQGPAQRRILPDRYSGDQQSLLTQRAHGNGSGNLAPSSLKSKCGTDSVAEAQFKTQGIRATPFHLLILGTAKA